MEYNELYHYGVKGMKWGVRKAPVRSGRTTTKSKKTKRSFFGFKKNEPTAKTVKTSVTKKEEAPKPKPKTVKDMSDSELREAINRLKLEEEYNRLSPKQVSTGKSFVDRVATNILLPAGEDVAKQLVKSGMVKMVNDVLDLPDELKVFTNNKKK